MPSNRAITIGASLSQLRRAAFACCWAIGLALAVQLGIWATISFTEIRWTEASQADESPLIVQSDMIVQDGKDGAEPENPADAIRSAATTDDNQPAVVAGDAESATEADVNRVPSEADATLAFATRCAKGLGTAGILVLLPMLMLSVLLAAGSAMHGSERAVSAFNLGIVVAILVLPLGDALSLPWEDGALASYATMTSHVDEYQSSQASAMSPFVHYARFLILPVACIVGTVLLYLRLSESVEQAIMRGDALRVDPDIEEEASNIKVGTAGNRAANALNKLAEAEQARNQPHRVPQPTTGAHPQPVPRPQAQPQPQPHQAPAPQPPQQQKSDLPRRII